MQAINEKIRKVDVKTPTKNLSNAYTKQLNKIVKKKGYKKEKNLNKYLLAFTFESVMAPCAKHIETKAIKNLPIIIIIRINIINEVFFFASELKFFVSLFEKLIISQSTKFRLS